MTAAGGSRSADSEHVHDWDDPDHPAPARLGPFACRCGQSVWLTETRPPAGWSVFGIHIDDRVPLEFSAAVDRDLMPAWERPVTR